MGGCFIFIFFFGWDGGGECVIWGGAFVLFSMRARCFGRTRSTYWKVNSKIKDHGLEKD